MPSTTFYIVRHGQTTGNVNPSDPNPDPHLTDTGRQQIQTTADALQAIAFDALYASDYTRAIQTAEILNAERQLELKIKAALRERDFGSFYLNKTPAEIQKHVDHFFEILSQIDEREYWHHKYVDDMESEGEALTRFTSVLQEIAGAHPGETVLVVGHGNLMRSFLMHLGFAKPAELPPMSFANAGYIKVTTDGDVFTLEEVVGATKRVVEKSQTTE